MLDLKKIQYKNLGFFRFKKLNGEYLLTNDVGNFLFLKEPGFKALIEGKLEKDKEPYISLKNKNFIKNEMNRNEMVKKYRLKHNFLLSGPILHIIIVTLRCNQKCLYCHASAQAMSRKDMDMNRETAEKVIEMIFKTPNPFVTIEFQGGEPLVNWPIVKFIIEKAQEKNKKFKKDLEIKLVSNFGLMTEEKYKYLLGKKVGLSISLDGPKEIHNKNRPGGDSHRSAAKWAKRFNKDYPNLLKKGYIWKMGGLTTISRFSLPYYKEIIDEYIKLGISDIFLRPLNPFGFSEKNWKLIGYKSGEFINFYKKSLDYIIKLNLKGKKFREKTAKILLTKILTGEDPNMMDIRSPCGAGIGQVAYNYNGDVYTCDEGRMMAMMGDDSFKIGNVKENSYEKIISSPTVKTLCSASCLDTIPGCSDCAYKPYCGVCPVYNYFKEGNIFSQMPNNEKCKINTAILDYLFSRLRDEKIRSVLINWLKR